MALLTKEQIEEVVYIFLNNRDTNAVVIKTAMEKWNEKQTTQQIEPDWDNAPDDAVSAVVHVTWVNKLGTWLGSNPVVTFERPAPVITPHPHAALIAKFAEVAARRSDPSVEFEYKNSVSGNWEKTISTISFFHDAEYRYIGDEK